MRLIVIGCTGFIGRSIGHRAVLNGDDVLGIARSNGGGVGWPGKYLQADLFCSDLSGVIKDFAPDVILHAAGSASVGLSFTEPLQDLQAGVGTWGNTLHSVHRSKLRPLILFLSSAAVYGNPRKRPISEGDVLAPISPYGFHKVACEWLAREYSRCFGLDILICRLFSVFGSAQRRLLIWELYQRFTGCDSRVWLDGTGAESRDYLDIDDFATALFQIIDGVGANRTKTRCTKGETLILNLASGEEIGVVHVAQQIGKLVASSKSIDCRGVKRRGEPKNWRADISLVRSLIPNWRPKPFSIALAQCIGQWQKERLSKVPSESVLYISK